MKSVLFEASSVLKAIEKAWEASGSPTEFTVKVLEQGEKKFFFFTERPAIVSIAFDPKHVAKTKNQSNKPRNNNQNGNTQEKLLNGTTQPHLDSVSKGRPKQNRPPQHGAKQAAPHHNKSGEQNQAQQKAAQQQAQQAARQQHQQKPQQAPHPDALTGWTTELAALATKELKQILSIMQIHVPFQEKIEQKTFTLTFAQSPLENKEDARLLFISLSYLLIQAIKKQEKKKLRGFHLIINAAS